MRRSKGSKMFQGLVIKKTKEVEHYALVSMSRDYCSFKKVLVESLNSMHLLSYR